MLCFGACRAGQICSGLPLKIALYKYVQKAVDGPKLWPAGCAGKERRQCFSGVLQVRKRMVFVPLLVAVMATACTATLRPPQPYGMRLPSTAVLGPEFAVFNQAASVVTTAVDGNGRVHLLIVASGSRDLYHAVIGPRAPRS